MSSTATGLARSASRSRTSSVRCRPTWAATTSMTSTFSVARSASPPRRNRRLGRCPMRSTRCTCVRRRATWCRCRRSCPSSRRAARPTSSATTCSGPWPSTVHRRPGTARATRSKRWSHWPRICPATSPTIGRARCSNSSARAAKHRIFLRWRWCSCSWCSPPNTRAGSYRSRSSYASRSPCSAPSWACRCAAWPMISTRRSAWSC